MCVQFNCCELLIICIGYFSGKMVAAFASVCIIVLIQYRNIISLKGVNLEHVLLLNTNRKTKFKDKEGLKNCVSVIMVIVKGLNYMHVNTACSIFKKWSKGMKQPYSNLQCE